MSEIEKIIIIISWCNSVKEIPKSLSDLDSFYNEDGDGCVAFIESPKKEEVMTILNDLSKIVDEENYLEVSILNSRKGYSIYINKEIENLKERLIADDRF